MIAEHGVSRRCYLCSQFLNALHSRLKRTVSLSPVVAGEHADIKTEGADDLEQMPHGPLTQVHMQIADLKDGELVKCRRQVLEGEIVSPDDYAVGVSTRPPIKPGRLQRVSNNRPRRVPILEMKEGQALAEDLGFVIRLKLQPRCCVLGPEAILQFA